VAAHAGRLALLQTDADRNEGRIVMRSSEMNDSFVGRRCFDVIADKESGDIEIVKCLQG
jgi:hypothetical protein